LAAANEQVQEIEILNEIWSLHNEKQILLENLRQKIKNKAISRELEELNNLIKEEENIINKLGKYIKEEQIFETEEY